MEWASVLRKTNDCAQYNDSEIEILTKFPGNLTIQIYAKTIFVSNEILRPVQSIDKSTRRADGPTGHFFFYLLSFVRSMASFMT